MKCPAADDGVEGEQHELQPAAHRGLVLCKALGGTGGGAIGIKIGDLAVKSSGSVSTTTLAGEAASALQVHSEKDMKVSYSCILLDTQVNSANAFWSLEAF